MTSQDEQAVLTPQTPQDNYSAHVMSWAKICADVVEDLSASLLGFVPNGLNVLYDTLLKPIPRLGRFFQHRWVEESIKLITGISIGQGVARDLARFFFKPLGFGMGAFLGSGAITASQPKQAYQKQIGTFLYKLSGQTVGGALLACLGLWVAHLIHPTWVWHVQHYMLAISVGALVGLSYRAMMLVAMNTVTAANAASTRLNADRAKKFSASLKNLSKEKVREKIKVLSKEIILQTEGVTEEDWEAFFANHLEHVALSLDKKIDRHLNVLTSRAVHGDFKALKILASLYAKKGKVNENLDQFLARVFNQRAVTHIQDAADSYYDVWRYRYLKG